jgi:hypothetical protein
MRENKMLLRGYQLPLHVRVACMLVRRSASGLRRSGHGRCNGGGSIAQEHACAMNRQNAQMLIYAKENHLLSKASAPNSKTAIEASTATVTASFGL